MIAKEQIESLMAQYVSGNVRLRREKAAILKQFRDIEQAFRNFELKLSNLEQRFHEMRLRNYERFTLKILSVLLDFNIYNMQENLEKVEEIISILEEIKPFIQESNQQVAEAEATWKLFKKNNAFLANRNISGIIEQELHKIDEAIKNADYDDIRSLVYKLKKMKESVKKTIERIEQVRVHYDQYFFNGERAEQVYKEIENLMMSENDISAWDFMEKLEEISDKIENVKNDNRFVSIAVPVVKIFKNGSRDIYEFGLRFGDFYLDYTGFADPSKDTVEYEETGEMMFFQHVPFDGIFNLEEVFDLSDVNIFDPSKEKKNKMNFDEKYIESVEMYHKKIYNNFMVFAGVALMSTLVTAFTTLGGIVANAAMVAGGAVGYRYYAKTLLKKDIEKDFNRKNFFMFSKVNLFIFSVGNEADIMDVGENILANIDDTIKNKKFREWFNSEGKNYV